MPSNPERRPEAVALAYESGESAPRIVAKGRGEAAEAIEQAAREAGVPVHESPGLARALGRIDLDAAIPPALYIAVAEVLAHLHRLERPRPRRTAPARRGAPR